MLEMGKSMKRKEQPRWVCHELIATPLPHSPAPLRGEGRKIESKVKPRKKGVRG